MKSQYGTPSYAMKIMRELMREWAREERKAQFIDGFGIGAYETLGKVLGARHALHAVGALTQAQYDKIRARTRRIIDAKVTRRPFGELREAA